MDREEELEARHARRKRQEARDRNDAWQEELDRRAPDIAAQQKADLDAVGDGEPPPDLPPPAVQVLAILLLSILTAIALCACFSPKVPLPASYEPGSRECGE